MNVPDYTPRPGLISSLRSDIDPPAVQWRSAILAVSLWALGATLCWIYGRRGYMPFDQSIVLDGAWRLLHGQVPYRDFVTPNGLVPMAMQAGVFVAFGVTWGNYVAHAAMVNGLFAAIVFAGLRAAGLRLWAAVSYGVMSAIALYPPTGTPYLDQHGLFFTGLVCLALTRLCRSGSIRWASSLPPLVGLAVLSKQIPGIFMIPVVLVWVVLVERERRVPYLRRLLLASLAVTAVLLITGAVSGMKWQLVREFAVNLPADVGGQRVRALEIGAWWRAWQAASMPALDGARTLPRAVVLAVVLIALGTSVWAALNAASARRRSAAGLTLLGLMAVAVTVAFTALTHQQVEAGLGLIPLACGLLHVGIRASEESRGPVPGTSRAWLRAGTAACTLWSVSVAIALMPAIAKRSVLELQFSSADDCTAKPAMLRAMIWDRPSFYAASCDEFSALAEYLQAHPRPMWLLSDTAVLNIIAGQVSPMPSVFLHRGLTLPQGHRRQEYERWLLRNLQRQQVTRVVMEGESTWMGITTGWFPAAARVIESARCDARRFGGIEVVELCGAPNWYTSAAIDGAAPGAGSESSLSNDVPDLTFGRRGSPE